jgi:hypothetical protein
MAYQSNKYVDESSGTFTDQRQLSSCLEFNPISEGMEVNAALLNYQSNNFTPSYLTDNYFQHPQNHQQRVQNLELKNPLDHPMINSLPNQFLKKLHWYLNHIYII